MHNEPSFSTGEIHVSLSHDSFLFRVKQLPTLHSLLIGIKSSCKQYVVVLFASPWTLSLFHDQCSHRVASSEIKICFFPLISVEVIPNNFPASSTAHKIKSIELVVMDSRKLWICAFKDPINVFGPFLSLNVINSDLKTVLSWEKIMKIFSCLIFWVNQKVQRRVVVDLFQ